MTEFKDLGSVMVALTYFKLITNGNDEYANRINDIAGLLNLFGIEWEFVEDDYGWIIARLK